MSKEVKKKPIALIIFFVILSLILIGLAALLAFQLVKLKILPDAMVVPIVLAICLFTLILLILLNFFTHGIVSRILYTILVLAICVVYGFGNYYIYTTSKTLTKVTTQTGIVKSMRML